MESVRKKLKVGKGFFELFGYDFIIDGDLNPWLIEVNTNPCLEESSKLLEKYIPRMVNDMLKLTVDLAFPPRRGQAPYVPREINKFPVNGYADDENMWDRLCSFDGQNQPCGAPGGHSNAANTNNSSNCMGMISKK